MRTAFLVLLALVAQVAFGHMPAASAKSLFALTLSPSSVTGGSLVTGTIILDAPAPVGGAEVALATSNPFTASVPGSVVVPEGQTMATFLVSTAPVNSPSSAMISAIYEGVAAYAMLSINPEVVADVVSIQKAHYDSKKRSLSVEATSNTAGATLTVYEQSTGRFIGTLRKKGQRYSGQFSWPADPMIIVVSSSYGGSATASTR